MKITCAIILLFALCPAALFAQTPDGKIAQGEYDNQFETGTGDFSLSWRIRGDMVYFAMRAATDGWVAIGIDPVEAMLGADMTFGYVTADGDVRVFDAFATGPFGPHPPDTEIDGTFDIRAFGGVEEGGYTTIEFSRARDTGDGRDKVVSADGGDAFIWAFGPEDDVDVFHSLYGKGILTAGAVDAAGRPTVNFLLVHIVLMSLAFVLMVFVFLLARYLRRVRWWLKTHRLLGVTSAFAGGLGIVAASVMVQLTTGMHIRVVHSYAGLVSLAAFAASPILGQSIFAAKDKETKRSLRVWHRWIGRGAVLLMLGTIVLGLFQAGFLSL